VFYLTIFTISRLLIIIALLSFRVILDDVKKTVPK